MLLKRNLNYWTFKQKRRFKIILHTWIQIGIKNFLISLVLEIFVLNVLMGDFSLIRIYLRFVKKFVLIDKSITLLLSRSGDIKLKEINWIFSHIYSFKFSYRYNYLNRNSVFYSVLSSLFISLYLLLNHIPVSTEDKFFQSLC